MYNLAKHFKGKICTIFTVQINRNFKEENSKEYPKQLYNYFIGLLEDYDENGILFQQVTSGLRSYFLWDKIVGLAEEELITDKKEISKIEKKFTNPQSEAKYLDPEQLSAIMAQTNRP